MDSAEFFRRFDDSQEIGRDITDTELSVFYDNGQEVGLWRENRATTVGNGSVLAPQESERARNWYANHRDSHVARTTRASDDRTRSTAHRSREQER